MLANIVISMELIAETDAKRCDEMPHGYSQHTEGLLQAVTDMREQSLDRIRFGETNIKSHMFLSMVLGQVEAMAAGKAPEARDCGECEG